ncbi:MAG: c-type cytochrome [Rhizomicrobium sp.]
MGTVKLSASLLFFLGAWTVAVTVQAIPEEANPSKGHAFALLVCAACHVVASDQGSPPILRNPGPRFDAIANRAGTTEDSLRAFLTTTHSRINVPRGMPNPRLADYQIAEVISYILSLRQKR